MVRASEVEGSALTGPDGSVLGTLERLLLHPDGSAVVVGAAVRPPATLKVVGRSQTYLPLAALSFPKDGPATDRAKLLKGHDAVVALGHDPDFTVIWTGMPLTGPSGSPAGIVKDFEFDPVSGAVSSLQADGGAAAKAAYGLLNVPAAAIVGYAAGAVSLSRGASELEASGGIAKAAAAAVVAATETVAAAGELAGSAVVSASGAAGRAIKAAKDAKVAEKTARRVGRTWRDTIDAFREGMDGED